MTDAQLIATLAQLLRDAPFDYRANPRWVIDREKALAEAARRALMATPFETPPASQDAANAAPSVQTPEAAMPPPTGFPGARTWWMTWNGGAKPV